MIRSFAEFVLNYLFGLSRSSKRLVVCLVDTVLLTVSFILAMALRLDSFSFAFNLESWIAFGLTVPLTVFILAWVGVYRAVVRHVSDKTLGTLAAGIFLSAAILLAIAQGLDLFLPRSVPIIYFLIALFLLAGARFGMSGLYRQSRSRPKMPVLIYGAGISGRQLLASLRHGGDYAPVGFIDDARELHGREIGGLRVFAPARIPGLVAAHDIESILLAIPSATRLQRKAILERLEPLGIRVQTIPGMADIVAGRANVSEIREVSVEDLLGRDLIPPSQVLMEANIRGKVVMVTGAGGSIGSELCRQIIRQQPVHLLLVEVSEFALYQIDQELRRILTADRLSVEVVPLLCSVLDLSRLEDAIRYFKVDTIFHAAAYKHVPLVEQNAVEGVRNNVFGTLTVARAAVDAGVKAFVLISTDKAVRPTNVMGASKRIAEFICQSMGGRGGTVFSIVRFGNVLGSSGSVIPLFRRQIEAGGPITVTHPDITRYFMAIPEAAQLVIQAGAMARGGEVFILDMGEPVRIVDLAIRMARLSGLKAILTGPFADQDGGGQGDIEIRFTELRPGEKLFEELLVDARSMPTAHPRILTAMEAALGEAELDVILQRLESACNDHDVLSIRDVLYQAPTGYTPADTIADLLWQQNEDVQLGRNHAT